ncbi:chorismate mutase [Polaromonas sp. CG_9.11]|uniref:chorismate mutase n=1 Tax=Polaromonas sp. CG_9.11 TaxID=2787730 RepID=UPI0018C9BF7E|nr:chorismate mutase [Polaromonas sp. CG_9.11]MBG6077130.1 isochorismate pyruvate lyase [Polaromonas sp. CG_9.11]
MTLIHQVEHCESMADVRRNIDALDERIVALMAERSGYMTQAARIKQNADQVHDQARIDFIVDRVTAMARAQGAPEAVIEAAYRAMIDASIEFEHGEFKRLRQEGSPP